MSIDDTEYRWVSDRIEYWNAEERILTRDEMQIANLYWNKYGKKAQKEKEKNLTTNKGLSK